MKSEEINHRGIKFYDNYSNFPALNNDVFEINGSYSENDQNNYGEHCWDIAEFDDLDFEKFSNFFNFFDYSDRKINFESSLKGNRNEEESKISKSLENIGFEVISLVFRGSIQAN